MKKLINGWHVPDTDSRVTNLLFNDTDMFDPSYEKKFRDKILDLIPNKRTFVDVGANVGIWSVPFSKIFKTVVAYEPAKHNFECLASNCFSDVTIKNYALANFNGTADFHQGEKNCGDSKISRIGRNDYTIIVKKLDDENLSNVDLIKIDVQGWELEVLEGAEQLLKKDRPWVLFEINDAVDACCNFLENLDYGMIYFKSKRMFIYAPISGENKTKDAEYGKYFGPGPYDKLLK